MIIPTPEFDPLFAPLEADGTPFRERMIRWIRETYGVDVRKEVLSDSRPLERLAA